jgi:hypothetical protein
MTGSTKTTAGFLALPFKIAAALYTVSIGPFWTIFRKAKLPEEIVAAA